MDAAISRPSLTRAIIALLLVTMTALTPFARSTKVFAATQSDDEAAVRVAVSDLNRFEQDGNPEALYDRMAPDARNVMPRSVWVAWYGLEPRLVPTATPAVSSIDFGSWTWDVTGDDYDDVATVAVTQTGTLNGKSTSQNQTLHFLSVDGKWKWFPLDAPSDIEDAVDAADAIPAYKTNFETSNYAAIDTFWAQNFSAVGLDYKRPAHITSVTRNLQVAPGCGTAKDVADAGIYYCTISNSIYYSPDMKQSVLDYVGDWAWTEILAHEWGHYIQDLVNIDQTSQPELDGGYYSIELELQADCLSGMFMQNEMALVKLDDGALDEVSSIISVSGDATDTPWDERDAHGTNEQRQASFDNGFENGFTGCRIDLTSD
ncbi:MAG TPA: neutral zinc metallopeptidase [Thermomicrobiales bacterium]|nr:neutral zinc metallopeptidase [Thermomicrobiales bacterium]